MRLESILSESGTIASGGRHNSIVLPFAWTVDPDHIRLESIFLGGRGSTILVMGVLNSKFLFSFFWCDPVVPPCGARTVSHCQDAVN